MNLTSRFSFLATLAACSIFFTVPASAKYNKLGKLSRTDSNTRPTDSSATLAARLQATGGSSSIFGKVGALFGKKGLSGILGGLTGGQGGLSGILGRAGSLYGLKPAKTKQHAEAQPGNVGTVYSKGRLQVNTVSKPASQANSGIGIEDCTIIQTFEKPATVQLGNGRYVLIKPNTIAQVCVHRAGNVVATVVGGGNGRGATVYGTSQQNWRNTVNQWLTDTGVGEGDLPGYLAWTGLTNTNAISGGGNKYP